MYIIVLLIILLAVALALGFSPLLAILVAIPLFIVFLAWVGLSRRSDESAERPVTADVEREDEGEGHTGIWGERTE